MMKCVVCRQRFNDGEEAGRAACAPGQGHMLQEEIIGSSNPDDKERVDFRSVDANDLKQWGEQAKKWFGDDSDK